MILSAFVFSNSAKAGQYFEDFSSSAAGTTTSFASGSKLFSTALGDTASVVDATYKELQLTASGTGNTRSAFLLPDLDPGTPIYAFSAKWNMDINGGFPNAADGFSFNFGQLGALGLINSAYAQESGYSTGLCFSVQTSTSPVVSENSIEPVVMQLPGSSSAAGHQGVCDNARHLRPETSEIPAG